MLARTQRPIRALPAGVLAAAGLTLAVLADAPAGTRQDRPSVSAPVTAMADDGLPGKGLPPSPGPTDPNGAG